MAAKDMYIKAQNLLKQINVDNNIQNNLDAIKEAIDTIDAIKKAIDETNDKIVDVKTEQLELINSIENNDINTDNDYLIGEHTQYNYLIE